MKQRGDEKRENNNKQNNGHFIENQYVEGFNLEEKKLLSFLEIMCMLLGVITSTSDRKTSLTGRINIT